jgi:uncharacterized protein YodC (DUF2158 family)
MSEFSVGDVVKLKSNTQKMTVERVEPCWDGPEGGPLSSLPTKIYTVWFDHKNKLNRDMFEENLLEKVPVDAPKSAKRK